MTDKERLHLLMNNGKPEIVQCAAIWIKDGKKHPHQPFNIESGVVFCGWRHCCIFAQLSGKGVGFSHNANKTIHGFLTSKNRFLNRKEAAELVKTNEQTLAVRLEDVRDDLFSEDLY